MCKHTSVMSWQELFMVEPDELPSSISSCSRRVTTVGVGLLDCASLLGCCFLDCCHLQQQ